MACKLTFAVVALLAAVQVLVVPTVHAEGDYDNIKKVLEEYWESAKDKVKEVEDYVQNALDNGIRQAKEQLEDAREIYRKKLEEAKANALDIKDCITSNEDQLQQIKNRTIDGVQKCSDDKKNDFNKVKETLDNNLKAAREKFDSIVDEAKKCWADRSSPMCVVEAMKKAFETVSDLARQVADSIRDGFAIAKDVRGCASGVLRNEKEKTREVAATIKTCIEKKLGQDS